jgi:large subunit ribosomal protein L7/L12
MSTIETIAESLDKLTVLEAVELRKLLEERWDVTAAAPVAMMAGPAGGAGGDAGGAAEKTDFDVELTAAGDKKIQVIKAVRELTGLGLFLGHAFLDRLRRGIDEILGLLEPQARQLAHGLDDLDLVGADIGEDDVKLRLLLFLNGSTTSGGTGGTGNGDRSGGGDAPALFEGLDEGVQLENGHAFELFDKLCLIGHVNGLLGADSVSAVGSSKNARDTWGWA